MTTPFEAGTKLTATQLNAALGYAWTAYTPTWSTSGTQPNINNGKLRGRWAAIGGTLFCRIGLLAGSTTSFGTNQWSFGMPAGLAGYYDNDYSPWPTGVGAWVARDVAGSPAYYNGPTIINSGGASVSCHTAGSSAAGVKNDVPFTWATTDFLGLSFAVELA